MKHIFKLLIAIGVIAIVAGLFFFIGIFFTVEKNRDEINSTAYFVIQQKEEIPDLKYVELQMCDRITSYNLSSIKDTVSENIDVPYKEFPCKMTFRYVLIDGSSKELRVEDFNCPGCSGTHLYILGRDTAIYKYLP